MSLELECKLRGLAFEFAEHLLPERAPFAAAFDALRLGAGCNVSLAALTRHRQATPSAPATPRTYSVTVAVDGDDESGDGSPARPFRTPRRARAHVRAWRGTDEPTAEHAATIVLTAGVYALDGTLELGAADSFLSFVSSPPGAATLSGGLALNTSGRWREWARDPRVRVVNVGAGLDVSSAFVGGAGFKRLTRARFPNGDPERDLQPTNWVPVSAKARWKQPGPPPSKPTVLEVLRPQRNSTSQNGMRPFYSRLSGGYAERFRPPLLDGPPRAWCNCDVCRIDGPNPEDFAAAADLSAEVRFPPFCSPTSPVGLEYDAASWTSKEWADPTTGVLHAFNDDFFSTLQWEIAALNTTSRSVTFGRGGNQCAQASPGGSVFYVENILEELDAPGEYFYDKASGDFYLYPNASAGVDVGARFVAPRLETLVRVRGSAERPVRNQRELAEAGEALDAPQREEERQRPAAQNGEQRDLGGGKLRLARRARRGRGPPCAVGPRLRQLEADGRRGGGCEPRADDVGQQRGVLLAHELVGVAPDAGAQQVDHAHHAQHEAQHGRLALATAQLGAHDAEQAGEAVAGAEQHEAHDEGEREAEHEGEDQLAGAQADASEREARLAAEAVGRAAPQRGDGDARHRQRHAEDANDRAGAVEIGRPADVHREEAGVAEEGRERVRVRGAGEAEGDQRAEGDLLLRRLGHAGHAGDAWPQRRRGRSSP